MVLCVLALTGGAYAQVGVGVAGTGDPGGFAIEGNLLANNPNVAPYNIASDWTDGPAGLGIGVLNLNGTSKDTNVTKHPIDLTGNDDQDVFKTGSNKVSDNPNSYNWVVGSVPQKDDIGNGYVHFSVDGSGNRWVAVGGDRRAINGDSYIDFEFLQNGLNKNSDGTFTAPGPDSGRTVGDFLLTIELTQGGSAAQFFAQKWLRDSSGGVQLNTFSYHDITGSLPPLTAFVAANIDSAVVVPWGAFGSTTYGINQFGEAVANVTALTNSGNDPCIAFQTVFIRTKSSQSATAELKDFIAPITFHICSDVTPPQITCPTDQTFECSSIGTFNNASATDNCPQPPTISEHRDTIPGNCPQNKDIRRIFTATDNCGNTAVCTSFVHIVDTTPPQLTCPAEQTFECSSIGTFGSASATDNCDQSVTITEVRDTSGTCPVNIRRIFTATDDCGNSSKCTTFVHIADTTPPQLTCPAEQTFECSAIGAFGTASATDNCDQSVSISEVRDTSGTCPVNIRRIFTATDDCGNTAKCTSFVHIADTTPPQLTCPAEQTFECDAVGAFGSASATDNCDQSVSISEVRDTSGTCPVNIRRIFTATDDCGNTAKCTSFVHIADTTPPQITCPADQNFECSNVGTFNGASATDNCDLSVSISEHRDTLGGQCPFVIRRIFTATDDCGNTAKCTSFVNITDTTPPQLTCPAEQTFECSSIGAFGSASATDNCDGNVTITEVRDTSGTCPVNIRRIFTATDDCGNTAKCTSFVHIADTTPPQVTCPAEQTFECSSIGAFGTASATDNCDQSVSISEVRDTSGTCPVNIRRIFTATDDCGNTAKCTTFVHIADTTPPQITCPAEQTFECNAIGTFNGASATDNCDQSVNISEVRDTSGTCPVNIRRIFTATDDCGNSAKCTTFVHIADTQAPTLVCHADTTIACNTTPVFTPPTASDNCDATPTVNLTADYSLAGQNGATIFVRTWTATDDCGNVSDSCSQHITVETCPGDTFCTLTQGAYGNAGGKWNGIGRLQLIQTLIGNNPLVIGKPGRSLTFSAGDASCIILRLPAGGPPATFPSTLGDATMHPTDCQTSPTPLPLKNDKFRNVFLGQLITISLNVRLDTDLGALQLCSVMNTSGGQILIPGPVLSSLTSLGLPQTVDGLIELANRAIAGQATGTATVNQISSALDAINTGFDECKAFLGCGQAVQGSLNRGNVEGTDGTINSVPTVFALHENYPNPFNPTTKINYDLPEQSTVRISVFNILGQEVATLVNGVVDAGYQSVEWNATSNNMTVLPSGLYMYRIQVTSLVSGSEFSQVRKMLLMK